MLIYIHGFNSSARSFKAGLLRERMAALGRGAEFACPELEHRPSRAMAQLEELIAGSSSASTTLIGSSLGGFYSTWLAQKYGLKTVLVNPAVRPYELLRDCLGPQKKPYAGEEYLFTEQHLAELHDLEVARIAPSRYLLLVATGDETLDYRQAVVKYDGCEQIVVEGGDHGFTGFADYLDVVMKFCGVVF